MSAKQKKRADRPVSPAGNSLRHEAERLIAKGRLKDAVKQAKLCFKEEGNAAHHRLLERAYFLRARQLQRDRMPESAREVARHLLDFGITDPSLLEEAAGLLLALGMTREALGLQEQLGSSPEVRDRFLRQAADQAVLRPEHAPESPSEIRPGALQVRASLTALEAGDEAGALAALRDVARGSPFADWRLFVRGLAAFQRGAADEARANWERLDPGRAAARIARVLQVVGGSAPAGPAGATAPDLSLLEQRVFGQSILAPLRQLRDLVAQDHWEEAIRQLGPLRFALRRVDPRLAERLTRILYAPLIKAASDRDYDEAEALVKNFTRLAEPLPIDPRWNRLWALIWEGPQGSLEDAEDYWRQYLDDLKTLPALPPEERALAQALVWKNLAIQYLHDAEALAPALPGARPDREVKQARRRAVECLEASLRLGPTHRATYQQLIDAYREWEEPEKVASVARRLLEAFPDDYETLMLLSDHHFQRDEPAPALEYVQRARALKPLDEMAALQEWGARVALARHLALQGRWDEGRAEFAAAERARPDKSQEFHYLARKAVFELKGGEPDRAEALITEAIDRLAEPTPLWLALRIEASRYDLPQADRKRFEAHWTAALAKKCKRETAGALAELLAVFLGAGTNYPGRDEHVKQVADYLRRTTRIKYQRDDLARVCSFLSQIPQEKDLYEKMVKKGLKLFPEAPIFLMLAGALELQKGAFRGNLTTAHKHFEKALERAQASSDPRDAQLLPKIKENLSLLSGLTSGPPGFPFPFAGFGSGAGPGFFDMFDLDDDEFDDEFDDEPAPRAPRGAGRKRRKR